MTTGQLPADPRPAPGSDGRSHGGQPWSAPSPVGPCPSSPAAFVACGLVQVFLAGLGVFDDPASFLTHRDFGYLLGWFTLAMLVLALLGRERRLIVGLTVLVLVQFTFQSVFVALRTTYPAVAALHPVNGFLLLVVGIAIARLAWAARHEPAFSSTTVHAPMRTRVPPRPKAADG